MIATTYWLEVILSAEIGTAELRHSESRVSVIWVRGESLGQAFFAKPERGGCRII
jgi:hypothetical protein